MAPDFVYIDGGHHIDTIRSDWNYLSKIIDPHTVVVFDDFYENKEKAILDKGCNDVILNLDPDKYKVELLDPVNEFEQTWGVLRVRFAKVILL